MSLSSCCCTCTDCRRQEVEEVVQEAESWGLTKVGPRPFDGWKGAQLKQYWKGTRFSPSE